MRTSVAAACIALALGVSFALPARERCFRGEREFCDWMSFYYAQPSPEKLTCALQYFADSDLHDDPSGRMPLAHFYAALAGRDPSLLEMLFRELSTGASERARIMALHVFWLADTDAARGLLDRAAANWASAEITRITGRMKEQRAGNVLERPLDDAAVLDNLWGAYFATGEEAYIRRLIQAAFLLKEGRGLEILIGGAAEWSLASNARQHTSVRDIVRRASLEEQGQRRAVLQEILSKSGERKRGRRS